MSDVVRQHQPGHIGSTPQNTDEIVAGGRVAGMLADYTSRFQPPEASRIDATLHPPDFVHEGYFTDDWTLLQITGAVGRMQPGVMRRGLDPKSFGDPPGTPVDQGQG